MNPRTRLFIRGTHVVVLLGSIVRVTAPFTQRAEFQSSVPWPFFVAEKSSTWVRPSPGDQQQVWDSVRFGGAGDRHQYYRQNFFLWPDGANVPYYIETWAGIRDADGNLRGSVARLAGVPNTDAIRGAFSGAAFLGFYSLLHKIEKIEKAGDLMVALVSEQAKGYEKLLFPWPAGARSITLRVIRSDGKQVWEQKVNIEDEK